MFNSSRNIGVVWLALIRIREGPVSTLGPEIPYPGSTQSLQTNWYLNLGQHHSLAAPRNSLFTNHFTTQRHVLLAT